jgi:hypothetical protein
MSFNSRKNLKQNNSNNDDGGGGIISGQAKKISAGQNTAFAIDSNDELVTWNGYGENVFQSIYRINPTILDYVYEEYPTTLKIKHIPEQRNVYGSTEDGNLLIGLDDRLIINDFLYNVLTFWGEINNTSSFVINDLKTATNIIDAGYNSEYLWYLKSDGTLKIYYVGYFDNLNNTAHKTFNNVSKCSINMFYGIILKTDGTLHTWPYTENAGNIVQYNSSLPSNLNNIKDISCGSLNPTILKHSGEIVEWGTFSHKTQARIPKPNINNAVKISAGFSHTLALLDNGTVVGWGFNNDNQIDIPTGLSNIIDISAGFNYSMALRSDGKIICWGNNYNNLCNVPERLRANIKTTKKIIDYNSTQKNILFLNSQITGSLSEYGYYLGESPAIGADKFNFVLSIPKSIYLDPDKYLNSNNFIVGGDNYSKLTRSYGYNNEYYQSVFSILKGYTTIDTSSVNTEYKNGNSALAGNYVYYQASYYPYSILRYISGKSRAEATFKDAIFLKNTSNPDLNNSLIIVGNFTVYRERVYQNNGWQDTFAETSNFYISNERGYQSDSHNTFNLGFNFSESSFAYQNTKVQSNGGTYDSNNISYKSLYTIRTIKQYKKDYIIFGDNNSGTHVSLYPNFYVRSLGGNGDTPYAWRWSGYTGLNFWIGVFKTTSPYSNKGVFDIEVQDYDDKILVAGNFISYDKKQGDAGSAIISTPVNNLCRLTSNFDSDSTFNTYLGTGFNDTVNKIHVQANNKILVGGKFTSFNGVTTNRLVRLNSNGTRDNTFNIGTGFDGEIFDILEDSDTGAIYVAGNFNYYNNENISGAVKLKQNGSLDYYFDVNKDYEQLSGFSGSGETNTRLVIGGRGTNPLLNNVNKIFIKNYDDRDINYFLSNINTTPSISYETYDNSTDVEFLNINKNTKLLYASSKVVGLTCQNQNLGGSLSIFGYPILTKLIANNLSLTSYYSDVFDNMIYTYEPYILNLSFNSLSSSPFDININSSINNSPIVSNTPNVISYESVDINMMNNSLTSFGGSFGQLERTKSLNINLQNNKLTKFEINYYYGGGGAANTIINLKNNNLTSNTIEDLLYTLNEYYAVAYYDFSGYLDISGGANAAPSSSALTIINDMRQNGWIIIHN